MDDIDARVLQLENKGTAVNHPGDLPVTLKHDQSQQCITHSLSLAMQLQKQGANVPER
jgi:hypothetical protein